MLVTITHDSPNNLLLTMFLSRWFFRSKKHTRGKSLLLQPGGQLALSLHVHSLSPWASPHPPTAQDPISAPPRAITPCLCNITAGLVSSCPPPCSASHWLLQWSFIHAKCLPLTQLVTCTEGGTEEDTMLALIFCHLTPDPHHHPYYNVMWAPWSTQCNLSTDPTSTYRF